MDDEKELDLLEVLRDIKDNIIKVIFVCVLFGVITGFIGGYIQHNKVEVEGRLLVLQNFPQDKETSNATSVYEEVRGNFIEVENQTEREIEDNYTFSIANIISIIDSDYIRGKVLENVGLNNKVENKKLISVTKDTSSDVINIICKTKDVELSKKVILNIVDEFSKKAPELMDVKKIELISGPEISEEHNLVTSVGKFGLIGLFGSCFLVFCYYACKQLFEDAIRNEEDIRKTLNLNIVSKIESYPNRELIDYITINNCGKVISFVNVSNNSDVLINTINEFNKLNLKVSVVDLTNSISESKEYKLYKLEKNDKGVLEFDKLKSLLTKIKKTSDYIFINNESVKTSHDYVGVSKYVDSNVVIVSKKLDKSADLLNISNDINLYNMNVLGVVYLINNNKK